MNHQGQNNEQPFSANSSTVSDEQFLQFEEDVVQLNEILSQHDPTLISSDEFLKSMFGEGWKN